MSSNASSSHGPLIKSSFSSASSLMALQLFSRLFTFGLNQALFRLASPRAFGAAAIQFELVLSTILFLSREGVRNALLRVDVKKRTPATSNLAFLPIALGVPLALATSFFFVRYASQEMREQPHFEKAIAIYAGAALVELCSEPMHNLAMAKLETSVRVRAEGLGITMKSVVTFLVLLYDSRSHREDLALLAFSAGQLAYGVIVFLTYVAYFGTTQLWFQTERDANILDQPLLGLSLTMTLQSLVKHFLTEGDKVILSWFSPLKDQGGYAIAVNYGSLIARIVFQPIEETLRVFFSKILPNAGVDKPAGHSLTQAADALTLLLSVQVALSTVFIVFGTAYLPILLPILLPPKYLATSAPQVLTAWVWYIPVLALNGGLEAFLSSAATPQELNQQSRWMIGFSFIYISAAVGLYGFNLGDASLVYANIINLSVRIAYSLGFVKKFYAKNNASENFLWKNALPSWHLFLITGLSALSVYLNNKRLDISSILQTSGRLAILNTSVLFHIILGCILAVACLLSWWVSARAYLLSLRKGKTE